jgi:hypothetical protein
MGLRNADTIGDGGRHHGDDWLVVSIKITVETERHFTHR